MQLSKKVRFYVLEPVMFALMRAATVALDLYIAALIALRRIASIAAPRWLGRPGSLAGPPKR